MIQYYGGKFEINHRFHFIFMLNKASRKERRSINYYFCNVEQEYEHPPKSNLKENQRIIKYLRLEKSSDILIPELMDDKNESFYSIFYCCKCKKWLKISNTISNIFAHLERVHRDQELINHREDNRAINDDKMIVEIIYHLKAFIILNGHPFSTIENPDLNAIHDLQPRANLVRDVERLAHLTKDRIKNLLVDAKSIALAIDEWQDRSKRRYLGITASTIVHQQHMILTIAHTPMIEEHCTSEIIRKYICKILIGYGIYNKIHCAVTDNGGAIPGAFSDEIQSKDNLPNIKRFPCICHIINIYVKLFVKCMDRDLKDILAVRNSFDNPCFIAYLRKKGSRKTHISSYTEIRWCSLHNLLDDLSELKRQIIEYNNLNDIIKFPINFWETLEEWRSLFNVFTKYIKSVEGNTFGLISRSLPCIRKIRQKLESLPPRYSNAKLIINQKMEKHWEKYQDQWTPILHVCTRLNPFIIHSKILTIHEIQIADETIRILVKGKTKVQEEERSQDSVSDDDIFDFMVKKNSPLDIDAFDEYLISLSGGNKVCSLLEYWTSKLGTKWNALAEIAMEFLSIPSSSATAERQFSITGQSIGLQRLKMSEDHVEDSTIILLNPGIARPILKSMIMGKKQ